MALILSGSRLDISGNYNMPRPPLSIDGYHYIDGWRHARNQLMSSFNSSYRETTAVNDAYYATAVNKNLVGEAALRHENLIRVGLLRSIAWLSACRGCFTINQMK